MKDWMETVKALLDLARQFLLAAVVLVVVIYPAGIGSWITATGVPKANFFGVGWETKFVKTDEDLQQSQADKLQLADQLKLANASLEKQKEVIVALQSDPAARPLPNDQVAKVLDASAKLVAQNQTVIKEAQANTQAAQQTIVANSKLVATAQQNDTVPPSPWAILAGSDPTETAARDEVRRAKNAGFANVKLIHNRGVYRTALIYPDRQTAAAALPNAKANLRQDAYVVSMDKFCPNRQDTQDLIECGN